jgi:hypothetical protein
MNPADPPNSPTFPLVSSSPHSLMNALTVTATTHTRTTRSHSLTALAALQDGTLHAASVAVAADPSQPTASLPVEVSSPTSVTQVPLTSDDIRKEYVQHLRQERHLNALREQQEAAATRIRRLLFEQASPVSQEEASPSNSFLPNFSILSGGSGRRNSRRQIERAYFRMMGTDLEELLIMEAMQQSIQDEEERQRRAASSGVPEDGGFNDPADEPLAMDDEDSTPIAHLIAGSNHRVPVTASVASEPIKTGNGSEIQPAVEVAVGPSNSEVRPSSAQQDAPLPQASSPEGLTPSL